MADKRLYRHFLADKYKIRPTLAQKLADILTYAEEKDTLTTKDIRKKSGFTETAKRYLRQLSEYGYLAPQGANKNRTYIKTGKDTLI